MKEFAQLVDLETFEGNKANELTKEQKRQALMAIHLIKLKRTGKLKGRTVADGRKQRSIYSKHETTSSTCHNDSLMLSLIVDALEKRVVATGDVPGAYLHAKLKDFTVLKFTGESVEVL